MYTHFECPLTITSAYSCAAGTVSLSESTAIGLKFVSRYSSGCYGAFERLPNWATIIRYLADVT